MMLYLVGVIRMNSTIHNNFHIYHALALNNRRLKFLATFFILSLSSLCMGHAIVMNLYISVDD